MTKIKIDHARILNAYLSRMTKADIDNISAANQRWTHAVMNYGNSEQLKAQASFYGAVCNSVNNLIAHDIQNIEFVIDEETT
jgi:predicted xylose isomerase-like sugar epimerase